MNFKYGRICYWDSLRESGWTGTGTGICLCWWY